MALETLDVCDTAVGDLEPLAGLSALQNLDVSSTLVSDLGPLAGLSALRLLDISHTDVADLEPLSGNPSLQKLDALSASIVDLAPLAGVTSLLRLSIPRTDVTSVAPLAGLTALEYLDISNTRVSDLGPLSGLTSLRQLDASETRVADLEPLVPLISRGCPVDVWWAPDPGIHLFDCPLTNPPLEIIHQGNEAILNYFRERSKGTVDHLYEAKVLILGEGGAGKTSLLRRLYQPDLPLPAETETTRGIAIYRHEFRLKNGRTFRLNLWDFGGQQIYHATHQFFLTRRSLYLLVDDTRKDSKSVSDEGFKYWLELIDVLGGRSPVLIFQNEKGGRSKAIDLGGIKGRYDNVKDLYAGNLEFPHAADRLREAIEFFAASLSHIGEQLPARWVQLRAEIEVRAAHAPYIPQEEYFRIYSRHMEFDRTQALHLSRYLHDLGVFLHFQDDPLLARTVILQNQWATEAVFRILDDESVKARFGRFHRADCGRLWRDSVYAEMHPELLALMQRFELCYELRDSAQPTWLATQLLPPSKPTELTDWGRPDDLVVRYRYEFLPKGMISRLTVRLHRLVRDPGKAWVTGVLFERDGASALVEVLPAGGEIELRARGPERKALLSVIAADLDALNDSFPGLRDKVDKGIPCLCAKCQAAALPHFFSEKSLLRRREDNRLKVECPSSYADVDVLLLLDGVRPETPRDRTGLRRLRIFLASSAELRADRDEFDRYFSRKGQEIVRWEEFLDAMSETRLQDEYNKEIRACDIFVCLFFTKAGKFTEEEFEVALRRFKDTGKPRIYTFFKDAPITTGSARKQDLNSLWAFQEKLSTLGHFWTQYTSIEDLKLRFNDQLDKLP